MRISSTIDIISIIAIKTKLGLFHFLKHGYSCHEDSNTGQHQPCKQSWLLGDAFNYYMVLQCIYTHIYSMIYHIKTIAIISEMVIIIVIIVIIDKICNVKSTLIWILNKQNPEILPLKSRSFFASIAFGRRPIRSV